MESILKDKPKNSKNKNTVKRTKKNEKTIKSNVTYEKSEIFHKQEDNKNIKNDIAIMDSIINSNQFDEPFKRKVVSSVVKNKYVNIDLDHDNQNDIIKKLNTNIDVLRREFNEYKTYVDETYCTNTVCNRQNIDIDNKLNDIMNKIELL